MRDPGPLDLRALKRHLDKVEFDEESGCWIWRACLDPAGYGKLTINERTWKAHNWFFLVLRGQYPTALELDHQCDRPACVNPWHMKPSTHRENLGRSRNFTGQQSRQTHCVNGHELTGDNLYEHRGHRYCRTCRRSRWVRLQRAGRLPSHPVGRRARGKAVVDAS